MFLFRCWSIAVVYLALIATSVSLAWAQPAAPGNNDEQARVKFRAGQIYYDGGQFVEAAQAFEEAYALSQRPQLLYNIFLAYRDAGQVGPAVRNLRKYLDEVPNAPDAAQLRLRLASMEQSFAAQENARLAAEAEVARQAEEARRLAAERQAADEERARADAEEQARRERGAGLTDGGDHDVQTSTPTASERNASIAPWIVTGVGGALALSSIATGVLAMQSKAKLEEGCIDGRCPASLSSERGKGQTMATMTDVLLFGGLAVAAGGFTWWLLTRDDAESPAPAATGAAACTGDGCFAQATVGF